MSSRVLKQIGSEAVRNQIESGSKSDRGLHCCRGGCSGEEGTWLDANVLTLAISSPTRWRFEIAAIQTVAILVAIPTHILCKLEAILLEISLAARDFEMWASKSPTSRRRGLSKRVSHSGCPQGLQAPGSGVSKSVPKTSL